MLSQNSFLNAVSQIFYAFWCNLSFMVQWRFDFHKKIQKIVNLAFQICWKNILFCKMSKVLFSIFTWCIKIENIDFSLQKPIQKNRGHIGVELAQKPNVFIFL